VTHIYDSPEGMRPVSARPEIPAAVAPKTSGLSIASLVCGIIGLITCCTFIPSVLGIVFGGVALPPILRGAARGRGLAVSGIVTGAAGLLLGVIPWIIFYQSPDNALIAGEDLPRATRQFLESKAIVHPGETIDYFYPTGFFSIKESGVVLTPERIALYSFRTAPQSYLLRDVRLLVFDPPANLFADGTFTLLRDDDDPLSFSLLDSGLTGDDRAFYDALLERINAVRTAAGLPLPLAQSPFEPPAFSADIPEPSPEPTMATTHEPP
jgi:hypothetical protein